VTSTAKRRQKDCRPGEEYRIISPEIVDIEVADYLCVVGRQQGINRYARLMKYLRDWYLRHVNKRVYNEHGRSGCSDRDVGKARQADTRRGRLNAVQKSY
jgi:hypothetical protein